MHPRGAPSGLYCLAASIRTFVNTSTGCASDDSNWRKWQCGLRGISLERSLEQCKFASIGGIQTWRHDIQCLRKLGDRNSVVAACMRKRLRNLNARSRSNAGRRRRGPFVIKNAGGNLLSFNPDLPPELKRLDMRIRYRGHARDVHLTRHTLLVQGQNGVATPIRRGRRAAPVSLGLHADVQVGLDAITFRGLPATYDTTGASDRSTKVYASSGPLTCDRTLRKSVVRMGLIKW